MALGRGTWRSVQVRVAARATPSPATPARTSVARGSIASPIQPVSGPPSGGRAEEDDRVERHHPAAHLRGGGELQAGVDPGGEGDRADAEQAEGGHLERQGRRDGGEQRGDAEAERARSRSAPLLACPRAPRVSAPAIEPTPIAIISSE